MYRLETKMVTITPDYIDEMEETVRNYKIADDIKDIILGKYEKMREHVLELKKLNDEFQEIANDIREIEEKLKDLPDDSEELRKCVKLSNEMSLPLISLKIEILDHRENIQLLQKNINEALTESINESNENASELDFKTKVFILFMLALIIILLIV
jgi:uncharacterized coiled-coil DUF342 family protein